MALVLADRVKETSTTTGTGTYTLAGAVTGFESFASIGNGNTTYYACTLGADFEVGIGTYTASGTTLARTTILQSSNSDNAVDWGAGTKTLFCTQPAEKAVFRDASGHIIALDGRNLTNVDAATLDSIDSGSFLRSDATDTKTSGNLTFSDDVKAVFGTGGDLEIFHDGSNSFINDVGTGSIVMRTNGSFIQLDTPSKVMAKFIKDGAVELRHNNSKKLETTSTGAEITGDLTLTSTDAGDTAQPTLSLYRNSASPAFVDNLGQIQFFGENNADEKVEYARIDAVVITVTDGSEAGQLDFSVAESGSNPTYLRMVAGQNQFFKSIYLGATYNLVFEGSAYNDHETTLTVTNPTADRTITLPDATGTVSLLTNTETLTNKTLTTPVINGFSGTGNATITGVLKAFADNTSLGGLIEIEQDGTGDAAIDFILSGTREYSVGIDNSDGDKFKIATSAGLATGAALEIDTSGNTNLNGDLTLTSTDAGSGEDPNLKLFRNSSSPANSDNIGTVQFQGKNNADETTTFAEIQSQISDVTDGAEDGVLYFQVRRNGTLTSIANVSGGSGRFNISNGDLFLQTGVDLIFEGATSDAHETTLTVTDPTADRTITLPNATGTVLLTDGDGSSLTNVNATTLDSVDSTSFLRSDAADTKTSGNLEFSDNVRLRLGSSGSSDLQIWHNGTNSNIVNGTGDLIIGDTSGDVKIQGKYGEQSIIANNDGSVELYHDNNKKLETASGGISVTGEVAATSLDISGDVDVDGTLEADAMTLNGTAITATATLSTGISNNNVPKFTSGVADNDFLRVDGTSIEGRSASEVLSDIGAQASLTFGISNTNAVKIDSTSVADNEFARFTANGLESRSTSEVLSDLGLGTISTQAADSVNIDGGAIDGVTLGTNSAITEAQIDDFNFNGNSVNVSDTLTGFVIRVNDEFVARFQSSNQTVGGGGLYLYQNNPFITFEGATADGHETNLKVTDPTADRDITLPDASGTVLTTGNSDTPTTTTSSSDADFVLVDDGGTMKKITPANLGITSGGTTAAFATAMAMVL